MAWHLHSQNMDHEHCWIPDQVQGPIHGICVYSALQAEGKYYNGLGLQGFMNGHLYECPNGHLFVIGECGQAMQVILQFHVEG